jgi:hypothetical protein
MKFRILSKPEGVDIAFDQVQGRQQRLLAELQACQEGRCTCPTQEYDKLESMQVTQQPDGVRVELKTKPGEHLKTSDLEACVQHTVRAAEKE